MGDLEGEVRKLRALVEARETGTEPEVISDESPRKPQGIVDYWCVEFQRIHGMQYAVMAKDAVNLQRLAKLYLPAEKMAWMVSAYLTSDDAFTAENGYCVSIFTVKAQGLAFKWVKAVQEPALRKEKLALEQRLREFEKQPNVVSMLDRVAK